MHEDFTIGECRADQGNQNPLVTLDDMRDFGSINQNDNSNQLDLPCIEFEDSETDYAGRTHRDNGTGSIGESERDSMLDRLNASLGPLRPAPWNDGPDDQFPGEVFI